MQTAWRERNPEARIKAAKEAIGLNPECATAYILLAEEEAGDIQEAETKLREAYRIAETNHRRSQQLQHQSNLLESLHRRDTNVMIYIRRRLAMCARKLGKLKEAVKMFKDLTKEVPPIMNVLNIHENLLEALLEMGSYADVQAVLAKYDDFNLPKSAAICYTAALLKSRAVADKFSADIAGRRGLSGSEMTAVEAIHRAVEFNPHVPPYLLQMRSIILVSSKAFSPLRLRRIWQSFGKLLLEFWRFAAYYQAADKRHSHLFGPILFFLQPPEHILKRGDSEAISYAFFHLQHWRRVDGALNLLHCTWEGTFRLIPYPLEKGHLFYPYPSCTECADRELLPAFHDVSVYPKKELPFFILFTAGLCSFTALLALLTHQYPESMGVVARTLLNWISTPVQYLLDKADAYLPSSVFHMLSKI
jgi:hypothetical protein